MFFIDYVTNDLFSTTLYGRKNNKFFRAHIDSFLPPGHPNALYLDTDRGYVGIQVTTSILPYTLEPKNHTYYAVPSHDFPHDQHEISQLTYFMMAYMLECL
jgi:hypothetical protein